MASGVEAREAEALALAEPGARVGAARVAAVLALAAPGEQVVAGASARAAAALVVPRLEGFRPLDCHRSNREAVYLQAPPKPAFRMACCSIARRGRCDAVPTSCTGPRFGCGPGRRFVECRRSAPHLNSEDTGPLLLGWSGGFVVPEQVHFLCRTAHEERHPAEPDGGLLARWRAALPKVWPHRPRLRIRVRR